MKFSFLIANAEDSVQSTVKFLKVTMVWIIKVRKEFKKKEKRKKALSKF